MKRNPILIPLACLALAWLPRVGAATNNIDAIREDHGVALTIAGMLIVYAGLAGICMFIMALAKVMALISRLPFKASGGHGHGHAAPAVSALAGEDIDGETLAAIGLVLHAEAERLLGQDPKVTIGLSTALSSPWALSSKMRVIPGRIKTT
jgi:hypothetical protein